MGLIQVLSPGLVNRIAAGECVERPASVIKELVENSLDAGATQVDITLLDGGRELIQVRDDGIGMDADDLRLSIHPHATSKIRNDDDLFRIHTLGFRGEALASIGSVSRMTITTRSRASDVGHRIHVDAGEVRGPEPVSAGLGTTIEVRDLFYCVPARRKFLRTNQTEIGHITEQLARLALAHPSVGFSLKHQQRSVHALAPGSERRQRIADLFGSELAKVLLPIRRSSDDVQVDGLVAPPAESRGSGKWEYVFVNGRFIRDRFISHAIREAYRSLIDPARFPVTFLFITIDPGHVDVNVHPTKIEVRWRDSNYIHGQVLAALREKFLSTNLDRNLKAPGADDAYRERVRAAMVDFFRRNPGGGPRPAQHADAEPVPFRGAHTGEPDQATAFAPHAPAGGADASHSPAPCDALEANGTPAFEPGVRPPDAGAARGMAPSPGSVARAEAARIGFEPISAGFAAPSSCGPRALQLHNTYLVVETEDGLMIIDQHALHERILYEEFRKRITQRALEAQRLLLPDVVRVPPDRIEALETHVDTLQRLGIELTAVGPQSVALHAFPSLLERVDRVQFVRDLLDLLGEKGTRPDTDTLLHDLLDMMACKAAVKAGDPLTGDEIAALLARRELAERSSNCPHGRPTTLHLTLRDLERQFKRR